MTKYEKYCKLQAGGWKTDHILKSVYRHAQDGKKKGLQEFAADYISEAVF